MIDIFLYDTHYKEKRLFSPIDATNVRMYVCGPTVYDYAHIGNGRSAIVFDMLYRLLRYVYGKQHVTYVRNITDIDDKIITRSIEENINIKTLTTKFTNIYNKDMSAIGALPPTIQPRATDHLPEMIDMIISLIENNHAYESEGHVLFDVTSVNKIGYLAKHNLNDLIAGMRVSISDIKNNPHDFILWKPSNDNQVGWNSPWGYGRPGWHLECSAMVKKHLGETIDIHGGGQDLIFPHHENEILQSECVHGVKFVNYWIHNGYLVVDGEKMAKSANNFYTVHDLLKEFQGEVLRMSLLASHYRQPANFSLAALRKQRTRIDRWYRLIDNVEVADKIPEKLMAALADDLNTPKALTILDGLATVETASALKAGAQFMGLLNSTYKEWFQRNVNNVDWIENRISQREEYKIQKDFAGADKIRHELFESGIVLEDSTQSTTWRRI